jgi:hypothetical protein
MWIPNQKIRVVSALICTLALLYIVPYHSLALLILLLLFWAAVFWPWRRAEIISFIIAAVFFFFQNYACLKAGIFEFKFKEILLMPYYEPFLWGFYFISLKRFVAQSPRGAARGFSFEKKSVVAVAVTSVVFSVFSRHPSSLLPATIFSTLFLFMLFHTKLDLYYAAGGLVLGFIVELFGVSTGLWSYPTPDFLGIPYWFATMWLSVGLLGCRFLIPLGEWLAKTRAPYGA